MNPSISVTKTRIQAGVWEGLVTGAPAEAPPSISVTCLGQEVKSVDLVPHPNGGHVLRIAIPTDLLADGVQTFLICDGQTGARLETFTIITGVPLEDDIRAEVDLLRAELDMLKKAFRRHCLETL
jgi:hypothetical protein